MIPEEEENMGNKMDVLFSCDDCDLGCTEVGNNSVGDDDDTYLGDGMLKLPKSLKDILLYSCKGQSNQVKN